MRDDTTPDEPKENIVHFNPWRDFNDAAPQIDVFGDATENPVEVDATPAPALASGPFRAAAAAGGLRVDWMTPGGGVQSTILLK